MATQVMSEKEQYLSAFEREYQTTLRVLKAYPADKIDLQPAPHMNSAKRIAWMLVLNQMVSVMALEQAELLPTGLPEPPATLAELLAAFEKAHADATAKIGSIDEGRWNTTLRFMTGPKQIADLRRGDVLWMFLMDTVHHRGQFSVYTRLAGGKLPSIYGPTADEPWN